MQNGTTHDNPIQYNGTRYKTTQCSTVQYSTVTATATVTVPVQQYNSTTVQQYNSTTVQQYNSTTVQQYNSTTKHSTIQYPLAGSSRAATGEAVARAVSTVASFAGLLKVTGLSLVPVASGEGGNKRGGARMAKRQLSLLPFNPENLQSKICRLKTYGTSHMDLRIPTLSINIMFESKALKSRILVRRFAVSQMHPISLVFASQMCYHILDYL